MLLVKICKVACIVTVYNKEKYFHRSLSSLLEQTVFPDLVIFIDDGSTDQSEQVFLQYESELRARGKIIYQLRENSGVADTRNYAASLVPDDYYIANLDADDAWRPAFIERVKSVINDNNYPVAIGTAYSVNRCGDIEERGIEQKEGYLNYNDLVRCIPFQYHLCCFVYKKNFVVDQAISFPSGQKMGEDVAFIFMVALKSDTYYIPEVLFDYYEGNSGSATQVNNKMDSQYIVYKYAGRQSLESGELRKKDRIFYDFYLEMYIKNMLKNGDVKEARKVSFFFKERFVKFVFFLRFNIFTETHLGVDSISFEVQT